MSIPIEDFTAFLKANAGISAIAGANVFPQNLPQKSATATNLPAVVYSQVSGKRPSSMEGVTGLNEGRYQFSCFALGYLQAKQLSQAVRQALNRVTGTFGTSTVVLDSALDSERDSYDNLNLVYRCDLDFMIWHREP